MPLCHCPWRAKAQSRRVEASAFYGQRLISASRNFLLFYGRTNFAAKSRNSAQRTAKAKLRITVRQQRYAKQRNATQLVRPELQISRSGPAELCRQILGKSRRRRALSFPLKAPWLSTARLPDPFSESFLMSGQRCLIRSRLQQDFVSRRFSTLLEVALRPLNPEGYVAASLSPEIGSIALVRSIP
jgi:hypothetical protein